MAIVTPIETPAGSRRRLRLQSPVTLEPLGEIELAFRVRHNPKLVEPPLVPDEPEMESEELLAKGRS